MQLKVIWDPYLHTDPEGSTLISNTALRFGFESSRIRDTLAACKHNRSGSLPLQVPAHIICQQEKSSCSH